MKIASVSPAQNISFKRRLTSSEEKEMAQVNAKAKQLLGNTGNSVLIVHDACLPQSAERNTGVANILNSESGGFFDFAKTYFGINTIEVLPQGEFGRKHKNGLVCAYGYSALGLNDSVIDAEALTGEQWRYILMPKEFKEIVDANTVIDRAQMVNYENINRRNSAFDINIRRAYGRFRTLDSNDPLKIEFNKFKLENEEWLTPKTVYHLIKNKKENRGHDWARWHSRLDQQLYLSTSEYSQAERQNRINTLLSENPKEADFYRFKQFVAEKHLQEGREILHKKGLKLFGDMPVNFSKDEIWANPDAFLHDHYIGANDWRGPCLNYPALRDENSAASRLLKLKARLSARRYDGTRIDVAWMYVNPKMIEAATGKVERLDLDDTALRLIEHEFESVQGGSYSPQNIIHEFKASSDDFAMFRNGALRPEVAERVAIVESEHLDNNWGSLDAFKKLGMNKDYIIYGVGDHTAQPLRPMALGLEDSVARSQSGYRTIRINSQAGVLAELYHDTVENLMKPAEFIRTKFADIMGAKHNFMFYMDPLGRMSRFDSQGLNHMENYRYKIWSDYKDSYHNAVQKGLALNLPDALARAFEKAGLAKEHPELYKKLCKFAKILKEPDKKDVVDNLQNTSNKLGAKKIALIVAGVCVVAGLGLIIAKNLNNSSNNK